MPNIFDFVGDTPLVRISQNLYAKVETVNPTGSIKDRIIDFILGNAKRDNLFHDSMTLVAASSGNTAISLAAAGAKLNVPVKIFMPCNVSRERRDILRMFDAEIHEVPPGDYKEAIRQRNLFLASGNAWSPLQFGNLDNILCHRIYLSHEIDDQVKQLRKNWKGFVAGTGTGGTVMGVNEYVKARNYETLMFAVQPLETSDCHGIQGIGDGGNFLFREDVGINVEKVSTPDAKARTQTLSKELGMMVGISSGANVLAAERLLKKHDVGSDDVFVTILPDRGERYLSSF